MNGATTRREALHSGLALYLASQLPAPPGSGAAAARRGALHRHGSFDSGIASGDPHRHGITLWTRLHGVGRPGRVGWEIAADPDFARVLDAGTARAAHVHDHTVHAKVRSKRLKPGRPYWYRFHTRHSDSPVGRFRTRPARGSRTPLRIAVYSCQDYQTGFYAAHRDIAAQDDLDLVVMVGDYIYERAAAPGVRADTTGANRDGDVQTFREYRDKYRLYRSDPNLQAMHAAHPHLAFWDSHDVEPHDSADPSTDPYGRPRRVPHAQRLRNGIRAFLEAMPQQHPADPRRIYRRVNLGALGTVYLTDEQLYGDPYPCPFTFPPDGCPEANAPDRTYLGAAQKSWLKRSLAAESAKWKLYLGGTMMMSFDFSPGNPYNTGQWDGFVAERRELMQHILDNRIDNVVRLSGDIHTFFAGRVTTTGRIDGTAAAVEFIGGSISSLGIPEGLAAGSGGTADPALIAQLTNHARDTNPHIDYIETVHRGYKLIEVDEDELRVSFRAPEDARDPNTAVRTLARFTVPAGEPVIVPA